MKQYICWTFCKNIKSCRMQNDLSWTDQRSCMTIWMVFNSPGSSTGLWWWWKVMVVLVEEVSKVVTFLWSSPLLSCPRLSALSCRSSAPLLHLSPHLCRESHWCGWGAEEGGVQPVDSSVWGALWRGGGAHAQHPAGALDAAGQQGQRDFPKGDPSTSTVWSDSLSFGRRVPLVDKHPHLREKLLY